MTTALVETTTRAALYLRISLDRASDGLAITRQREDCERILAARGWRLTQVYTDVIGASDDRKARPEYDAMVADFDAGRFDALICWDLDRLTRQPVQLEGWIKAAEQRGLRLVTANGEADLGTDAGVLFARIKIAVAKSETDRKAARQQRANRQRAEAGRPPSGPRLLGYATTGELIPAEAAVVAGVFEAFVRGESLRGICADLNAKVADGGLPARRGRWVASTVRSMLVNPRYVGRAIYQGQVIDADAGWPAIIDEPTWTAVQAILADPRRRTQTGTDRKYLGSGLYVCGVCEGKLTSWSGNRYACREGCITRRREHIDAFVTGAALGVLADEHAVGDLLADNDDGELAELIMEAKRLTAALRRTEDEYYAETIPARIWRTKTDRLNAELAEVERRQSSLIAPAGPTAMLSAADPVQAFRDGSLMAQRAMLDFLLDVTVHPAPRGRRGFDPDTVTVKQRRRDLIG